MFIRCGVGRLRAAKEFLRTSSLGTPTTRQLTNNIFFLFLHVWRRFPFCHSPKLTAKKLTPYGYFSTVYVSEWQNGNRKFFWCVCGWNDGECREKGGEWDDLLGVCDFFGRQKKPNWTTKAEKRQIRFIEKKGMTVFLVSDQKKLRSRFAAHQNKPSKS